MYYKNYAHVIPTLTRNLRRLDAQLLARVPKKVIFLLYLGLFLGRIGAVNAKEVLQTAKKYARPSLKKSWFQIANTFLPFVGLLIGMYWLSKVNYWLALVVSVPTAGLLLRIFIIQHDCGHGSFFRSETLNNWVGRVMGVFTLTPYTFWKTHHNIHHATSGNLDKRNIGDVPTLTVDEYTSSSLINKLYYRFQRNPFTLLPIGAPSLFILIHRFPWYVPFKERALWISVLSYNIVLTISLIALIKWLGPVVVLIYLPVIILAAMAGTYMFFIQHQFEGTYWKRSDNWTFAEAAYVGSSYYKLPGILNWFTGNIAYHHIHHLCSKIPNYELKKCHFENRVFFEKQALRFYEGFTCFKFKLWDEQKECLVPYPKARN